MTMKAKKKSPIRAIDKGTRYDITGLMRRTERQIERGEFGDVSDAVILLRQRGADGSVGVKMYHFGTGTTDQVHFMLATGQNRIEPA